MFFDRNILVLKFFLVENVFAEACTNTFQIGDVIGVFLDRFDLFFEELFFKIVRQVRIAINESISGGFENNLVTYLCWVATACSSSRA